MNKIFGLPILLSIITGYFYPYTSLSLSVYGFISLFLLMFFSGFSIEWKLLKTFKPTSEFYVAFLIIFLFSPLIISSLTNLLINDQRIASGVILASLMPVAVVAPFFTKMTNPDTVLSFMIMIISTLCAPIIAPLFFYFLSNSDLPIQVLPLALKISLFVTIPLSLSYIVLRLFPKTSLIIKKNSGILNAISLSVLFFILTGITTIKVNLNYIGTETIIKLFVIAFICDFGVYFLTIYILKQFFEKKISETIATCVSMKNIAVSAGIMTFYSPKAALPSIIMFIIHSIFWNFLILKKNFAKPI